MRNSPRLPDFTRVVDVCLNRGGAPFPLYEHNVSIPVVEAILGRSLSALADGDDADRREFFSLYSGCLASLGYDTVPFEGCVTELIQGGEALCGRAGALVKTRRRSKLLIGMERWKNIFVVSDRVFVLSPIPCLRV